MEKHATQFYSAIKLNKRNYLLKACTIIALMCCPIVTMKAEPGLTEIKGEQQSIIVKGTISDAQGSPVPGAVVQIKGTTKATMADIDGNFELGGLSANDILVVSFMGMRPQEVKLDGKTIFNIRLQEDVIGLEDVVVLGYTTTKKKDLTGSVVSINSDVINRIPANDIRTALTGLAGVRVSGNEIRIRGNRSPFGGNDPLIILDGMTYFDGLQTIEPSDVESIDVLKDASSTALYGSKGANGVIIITTKKAKKGVTSVDYDAFVGTGKFYNRNYKLMNADEYVSFWREAYRNSAEVDKAAFTSEELANMGNVNEDWLNEYTKNNTYWTSQNLAIASSNDKTNYRISFNHRYEKGRLEGVNNHRFFLNTDINHQLFSNLKIGMSTRLYYNKNKVKPDPFTWVSDVSPLIPIYNEDGSLNADLGNNIKNPFLIENDDSYDEMTENWKAFIKMYATVDIMKDLKFTTNFSYNQVFYGRGKYIDERAPNYNQPINEVTINNNRATDWVWNNVLNYKRDFGKHTIDAIGVFEMFAHRVFNSNATANDQLLPAYKWYNMGDLKENKTINSSFTREQMMSYLGRIQYDYDDRYLATLTVRRDGSSKLSEGKKWDIFPSFALAWRVSEESFMEAVPTISNLKARFNFGTIGNHGITPYGTLGKLNSAFLTFNTPDGEKNYIGLEPGIMPTPSLKWEKSKTFNYGLDYAVLNGRISGTIDYYITNTYDLLFKKKLPYTSGFQEAWDNIGKTRNRGIELTLSTIPIEMKDLSWGVNLSYTRNKEELKKIYDSRLTEDVYQGWWLGYPINGVYYNHKQVGIWQKDEADLAALYGQEPGEVKVKDLNADGKIDDYDKMIIGTTRPKWTGSLQSSLRWKDFDFAFDLYGEFGAITSDGYVNNWGAMMNKKGNTIKLDYWTEDNPVNRFPRPTAGQTMKYINTTGYYKNDYVELRNVTLGYTLNKKIAGKFLKKARFYVSVNNPYRYWKFDRDGGIWSHTVTYLFGTNIQF
ncbi:MAG: TonB-dependent receptor [Dysgonomonas sp.]|nr:TonB-dependent receptor [Dysgonomonas sp.]